MKKCLRLSEFAKLKGITYTTAHRWFKKGLITNAFKSESGSIFVEDEKIMANEIIVTYSRVSSNSRRAELQYQVGRCQEFCRARGLSITKDYYEVASGMNDNRKQLWKMLDSKPSKIIVENKDRLTRFGFNYLERLLHDAGCEVIVINSSSTDEQDLIRDLVSVITSFCCRLYGLRRTKNKLAKIKAVVEECCNE